MDGSCDENVVFFDATFEWVLLIDQNVRDLLLECRHSRAAILHWLNYLIWCSERNSENINCRNKFRCLGVVPSFPMKRLRSFFSSSFKHLKETVSLMGQTNGLLSFLPSGD